MHKIQCYFSGKKEPREYETIADALKDQGVVVIVAENGGFEITDGCDLYYSVFLTPPQLAALGEELISMSKQNIITVPDGTPCHDLAEEQRKAFSRETFKDEIDLIQ